ncbi:hypothetical protein HanIR_Chr15g0740751 [Helianthus annuus]|nr:hypothetical protein HanIR_Chr15g0740751 [Helianthus annuus]
MPPPHFTTETQTQTQTETQTPQTPTIAPQSNTTTQPIHALTGDFHVIGLSLYPLENLQPLQPNPLWAVNQSNQVPHCRNPDPTPGAGATNTSRWYRCLLIWQRK